MSEQITQHILPSNEDVVDIPQNDNLDYASLYPSVLLAIKDDITRELQRSPEKAAELEEKIKELEEKMSTLEAQKKEILKELMKETLSYGHIGIPFFPSVYGNTPAIGITAVGRQTIKKVKEELEGQGYTVVYGDTDTMMVKRIEK
mgnify:CR=1 FL=1